MVKTSNTAGMRSPEAEKLPPHDSPAEAGILGCILLSPKDCLIDCIKRLPGPEVFYSLVHQNLYRTFLEMWEEIEPIDIITLQQRLKQTENGMADAGGLAYICSLPDSVPSAANLDYYIDIVLEKYVLRKILQTGAAMAAQVHDHKGDAATLLAEAEQAIMEVGREIKTNALAPAKELVSRAITKIEILHQNKGALSGIATGFHDFDRMTNGLEGGQMIVIAGLSSSGKSTLGMNIADHVAVNLGLPVGVFSLEMSAGMLMMRCICSRARVNLRNVRDGFLSERDFPNLSVAASKLSKAPLHIDDTSGLTILQLRGRARGMSQSHGVKLFIIDYLQLVHGTSRRSAQNRQLEVSEVSEGIRQLAKELNVPIIACAQLNRDEEKKGGGRPGLASLRESGKIGQDADIVGLLFREKDKDDEDRNREAVPVKLFVAKQRDGPTGDVDLTFLRGITRFESTSKVSENDYPDKRAPHND